MCATTIAMHQSRSWCNHFAKLVLKKLPPGVFKKLCFWPETLFLCGRGNERKYNVFRNTYTVYVRTRPRGESTCLHLPPASPTHTWAPVLDSFSSWSDEDWNDDAHSSTGSTAALFLRYSLRGASQQHNSYRTCVRDYFEAGLPRLQGDG